jgi:hypothetical protein
MTQRPEKHAVFKYRMSSAWKVQEYNRSFAASIAISPQTNSRFLFTPLPLLSVSSHVHNPSTLLKKIAQNVVYPTPRTKLQACNLRDTRFGWFL